MSTLSEIRQMPTVVTTLEGGRPVHQSVLRCHGILQWVKQQLQDADAQANRADRVTVEINPGMILQVIEMLEDTDNEKQAGVLEKLQGQIKQVDDILSTYEDGTTQILQKDVVKIKEAVAMAKLLR